MVNDDINDLLLSGGTPWARFDEPGDIVEGTVLSTSTRQSRDFTTGEPKAWPDGNPMMEAVIQLQTTERSREIEDDDGTRQLVINKAAMKVSVANALRKAKSKLETGGTLKVIYTGNAEPKQRGMQGAKQFEAIYAPPALSADDIVTRVTGDQPNF